jgi:asparagine N-glycosylation enzyme membrane subunit Stt3
VRGRRIVAALGFERGADTSPEIHMLYTIAVILLIAWLLGFVGIYTIGSLVHVLLVVAIVLFLAGLISGRRTLA